MNGESSSALTAHPIGPLTVNRFGERFLFNLNRHSFDQVSAEALFDARFGKSLFRENSLSVIIGSDSGLLPRYVQTKSIPNGARYIFIEPEPVLLALREYHLLDELDDRILCICLQDWAEAISRFKINDYLYINSVYSFNAICAEDDFIDEYAELGWGVVEVLSRLHWENNTSIGQEAFIDRQLKNVAENRLPAKLLQNAFHGQTVIILAGGPSLDDALPWVKKHRRCFVVFAVSRVSRQLLAAGIEPDFVFSVDPQDISFDISKEMFNFGPNTVFIASYHVVPTLANQWQGLMLYLGQRLPWESELNEANIGGAGPTVTNTALSTAHAFGFKQVLLAGVDLCFTRDGFTHAKGSNEHQAGPKLNLSMLQVETNGGYLAPTGSDYAQAIKSLEWQARVMNASGARVINTSLGAAKIDQVEYLPWEEIPLNDLSVETWSIVASKVRDFDLGHYLRQLQIELQQASYKIQAISDLAEKARRINDTMYNSSGILENYRDKKQLDRIERKFKHQYRRFSKLVKRFGIRQFLQAIKPFADEDWTAEEAKALGNIYYDAYKEGASKLQKLIEDAMMRVAVRQQEIESSPDFDRLFEQWRKDRSFGRGRLWRRQHQDAVVPEQSASAFDEFERLFAEVIAQQDTRHLALIKAQGDLAIVRSRSGVLFKHKKNDSLRDLLSSLDKHAQQEAVLPYRLLINGYLDELEQRPESAMEAYRQILDAGGMLLEEALIRIAAIGIEGNDVANVNLALECLSQLNPVFLPFYAEIQRLKGDMMGAVDSYNAYVSQFPNDFTVQMKLAMLYIEGGVYDAAELMLDYILQQKPEFDSAIKLKYELQAATLQALSR